MLLKEFYILNKTMQTTIDGVTLMVDTEKSYYLSNDNLSNVLVGLFTMQW